jgi:parallel beta-helix repeat protein
MRLTRHVLVGACAGLTFGLLALPAAAAEWFVSPQGSDTAGDGSLGKPLRTLGHLLDPARELVRAGDTVTLRGPVGANVFDETEVRLRVPITLRSYEGEWAVIRCPIDLADGVCIQVDPDASGSRLSRLEVTGGNLYGIFFQTDWDSGNNRQGRGASNVIVEDCRIHDTGRDAIKITPKSDDITIRRCEIYNTGRIYPPGTPLEEKNAEGIDNVNGSRMLVEDCHIHDIATNGLYFKGGAADVVVQRNRIERVGEGGIMVGYDTSPEFFDLALNPNFYESVRGTVRNNVVRDTGYAGIGLYAAQDAVVANNTIVNAAASGHAALYFGVTLQDFDPIAKRPASINPVIRNNLVIQSGGYCGGIRWANEITDAGVYALQGSPGTDYNWYHDTTGECRFFDNRPGSTLADGGTLSQWRSSLGSDAHSGSGAVTVTADGHLPAGSPVIDRGVTLAQVGDDMDGQARQAPIDIGADEYAAASTDADRVMNWAEAVYGQYFPKGAQAGTYLQYRYRYYPSTGNYLGTDGTRMVVHNGRDWNLLDVGALADFLALAAAAGY